MSMDLPLEPHPRYVHLAALCPSQPLAAAVAAAQLQPHPAASQVGQSLWCCPQRRFLQECVCVEHLRTTTATGVLAWMHKGSHC